MRRFTPYLVLSLLLITTVIGMAQTQLTDEQLLRALDEARLFDDSTTGITASIVAETPEETSRAITRLRFKTIDGESYARIEFLFPEELVGQVYLSTPEATYFVGPDLDFPIKTSANSNVFGDAAVAQTSGIEFLGNYEIVERREVILDNENPAIEVDLEAIDFSVAFQSVTVTAELPALAPVKMTLYALSGLAFYDVYFEEYATNGEDVYAKLQRIENLFLEGNVTKLDITDLIDEEFPEDLFNPQLLQSPS